MSVITIWFFRFSRDRWLNISPFSNNILYSHLPPLGLKNHPSRPTRIDWLQAITAGYAHAQLIIIYRVVMISSSITRAFHMATRNWFSVAKKTKM
jgi:hypothetical protein